jgi:ribosomal protein S18 acetylase RimI-like enzyme
VRYRAAEEADAEGVALLHADSWRRHYRGAYADAYLDGDVVADRLAVWGGGRLKAEERATVVAESPDGEEGQEGADGGLLGFVHVVFDEDERWGSLIDNLHVSNASRRTGVGAALMERAARVIDERAAGRAVYLWVLEQNTAAQGFYRALGATHVETTPVGPPGGVPERLNGAPRKLRLAWTDVSDLRKG